MPRVMGIPAVREGGRSVSVLRGFPLCALPGDFLWTVFAAILLRCWGNRISGMHFFSKDLKILHTQVVSEVYLLC